MNSTLHFSPEDIRPAGRLANHTTLCYVVCEDDQPVGQVNVQSALALINAGEDMPTWLAGQLNDYLERGLDEAELRKALEVVLAL